jgi:mannonate dehydratase
MAMNQKVHFTQSMRWYGPNDIVKLSDLRQAGCTGVVTALHQIPVGEVWSVEEIKLRQQMIAEAGMEWTVVESLPVHEGIKTKSGDWERLIANYQQSLQHLGACGIKVITYNFMPILDWMRTDVSYELPGGSKALRFERQAFVAFDLFLLQRPGAEQDYSEAEVTRARRHFEAMDAAARVALFKNTMLGLPGSDVPFTPEFILSTLGTYAAIDADVLRSNLKAFLQAVVPVAEEAGLKMAIHPDDPPYSILGLPRIVSTAADLDFLLEAHPSTANGLCYCTGSLGVRADNDLKGIIDKHGKRIHFVHLRNVKRDADGNFYEANHLDGDVDMYGVVKKLVQVMQETGNSLTMRPDHGHQMLDDLHKHTYPGYSAIGRLKGLAELRGLEHGILNAL